MSQTLGPPQCKGKPGWEFTDLSGLDLSAYAPAPEDGGTGPAERAPLFSPPHAAELRQVDAGTATLTGELPEGVIVGSLEDAPAELVERYLGTVVPSDDVFVARNDA